MTVLWCGVLNRMEKKHSKPNRVRKKKGIDIDGWLVLDKSLNLTSTDAVNKVKRALNANKAGHAGTLDPLASGILPIALGEATRTVAWLMEAQKTYEFTILWGNSTSTQDMEGEVIATSDVRPLQAQIESALLAFIGEIDQIPPAFSAIKVDGVRAYDLARSGNAPTLEARKVKVFEASLSEYTNDTAKFFVRSGKGFYVRGLARDLAHALGTEGHIIALRRTSVGPFNTDAAITLETLEKLCIDGAAFEHILPATTALDDIPELAVSEQDMFALRQGRQIIVVPPKMEELKSKRRPRNIAGQDMSRAVLATHKGKAIAIGDARAGKFRPTRVFN